jgi:hypothetical protein
MSTPQVVLFVMWAGVPPFHDDDDLELMKRVKKGFGAPGVTTVPDGLRHILR